LLKAEELKKLSDRNTRKDHFHQRAKKQGFRARSVFKLEEIDQKLKIVPYRGRILDLGCNPGAWLQYCAEKAGPKAVLVGLDRTPLQEPLSDVRSVIGDVHEVTPEELLGELEHFDLVMSDMAPDTTGIRHMDQARSEALFERALYIATECLSENGNFVGKLFQGPDFQKLIKECRRTFTKVKIIKPKGSRSRSLEQYIVGCGFKAPPLEGSEEE